MPTDPRRQRLQQLKDTDRQLQEKRNKIRDEAAALVVALLRDGHPPTDVAKESPFSAAHVRVLARKAGLPPATKTSTLERPSGAAKGTRNR